MAAPSDRYGLGAEVGTDNLVTPEHRNLVMWLANQLLPGFLDNLFVGGVASGWDLLDASAVGPGYGLVHASWCDTTGTSSQAVAGMQANASLYVYAVANASSPQWGEVNFTAELNAPPQSGKVYLGWYNTDGDGNPTHVNGIDVASAYENDVRKELLGKLQKTRVAFSFNLTVPANSVAAATVTHTGTDLEGLRIVELTNSESDVILLFDLTHDTDSFTVVGINDTAYELTATVTGKREGYTV